MITALEAALEKDPDHSNYSIYIDDVYLYISYILIERNMDVLPIIIAISGGTSGLILEFSLYQAYFR